MSVNFQYSTASCVSHTSSTKTLIWEVVNPRVTWSFPVNALVVTVVETFTRFVLTCEESSTCSTVQNYGAPVGGFVSASGVPTPYAYITCN